MGVLNVTPDSFSDGGRYVDPRRAADHALEMEAAGAAIIDIGGESTRPRGAREVPAEIEIERIMPVLKRLEGRLRVPISIDTRKAAVARVALDAGAAIVNDVSALNADPAMAPLVAARKCAVVLMHMRGGPADHMKFAHYRDVVSEVEAFLASRARATRFARAWCPRVSSSTPAWGSPSRRGTVSPCSAPCRGSVRWDIPYW